ncbi:MAG: hypothetical protein ACJAXT_001556 [Paracoccaceae bacterium]|jgi:hypothetical protein
MLNLGRASLIMLVVLTVVYVCLLFYWRAGAKDRALEDWVMQGRPGDRDEWVKREVAPREAKVRRWLILCVYVVPLVGVSAFVYLINL